jgi:hypothetical protein
MAFTAFVDFEALAGGGRLDFMGLARGGRKLIPDDPR